MSTHAPPAFRRLMTLAILAFATGCFGDCGDDEPMSLAECLARLDVVIRDFQQGYFPGDAFTVDATFSPPSSACPTTFTWTASGTAVQLGNSTGPSVTGTAVQRGTSRITATAGTHSGFTDFVVTREEGDIVVNFSGLSGGAQGSAVLTGPGNITRNVTGNMTLMDQPPGTWNWTGNNVTSQGHRWTPDAGASFTLGRNATFQLNIPYNRETAQVDFRAGGVPAAFTDDFGSFSNAGRTFPITMAQQSFVMEPGLLAGVYQPVDMSRWFYVPQITTATGTLSRGQNLTINIPYNATRGEISIEALGLPAGTQTTGTLAGGGQTASVIIPGMAYRAPGSYTLGVNPLINYRNAATNRFEDYLTEQSTYTTSINAGQSTTLDVQFGLAKWRQQVNTTFTILLDPFGHHTFVAGSRVSPIQFEVSVPFESPAAGAAPVPLRITGAPQWVTLDGMLNDDLTFLATGSGTVANFPNVPVQFTGTLNADGSLTGQLRFGQDVAPTGLPNGSITYTVTGTRAAPGADRGG